MGVDILRRKWDVAKATKLLTGTLEWRRSFGVDSLTTEKVKANGVKGKLFVMGADRTGRPTLFMRPGTLIAGENLDLSSKKGFSFLLPLCLLFAWTPVLRGGFVR